MRNLWVVRSRRKLFTGIAFALGGFLLFYTILTLLVLEPEVPFRTWPFPTATPTDTASKSRLLILPLVSLALSILLHFLGRWTRLPLRREAMPEKRQSAWGALVAGENFLLAMLLFFWQLDRLNFAKGIPGFSSLMPILIVIAIGFYGGYAIRKMVSAGTTDKGEDA